MSDMTEAIRTINGAATWRRGDTIFIRLPRALWRSCGTCQCPSCRGGEGYWDTLAVNAKTKGADYAWTVHWPDDRR